MDFILPKKHLLRDFFLTRIFNGIKLLLSKLYAAELLKEKKKRTNDAGFEISISENFVKSIFTTIMLSLFEILAPPPSAIKKSFFAI